MTRQKNKPLRILVVDDHPIVREGLSRLLQKEPDFTICGEADNSKQALQAIESVKPNFLIIDIALKGTDGVELIKNIKARYGAIPILTLSMHDEALYAERALRAGARGYLMKQESPEKVITAIRAILSDGIYLSQQLGTQLLSRLVDGKQLKANNPVNNLTDRELEIFQLIGRGRSTRQIALNLHLSIKTVESHRARIKTKLTLNTATELVQHAIQWIHQSDTQER